VNAPRVVCAPDKLRGTASAAEAAVALAQGVRRAGGDPVLRPMADGGEGTLAALVAQGVARLEPLVVRGLLGAPRRAALGVLADGVFLVEVAQAVGRGAEEAGGPLQRGSAGVGDLILGALERGARRVLVALGGTLTVDGGLGMLEALGADVPGGEAAALLGPLRLGLEELDPRLRSVELVALYDVDVPLCGEDGAALLFGPQKGLDDEQARRLDGALARLAAVLGDDVALRPGAGAAGGLGAALYALGAQGRPGAAAVRELVGLDAALAGAALCLTAEGSLDRQSGRGKAPAEVVRAAVAAGVPCVVCGGVVTPDGDAAMRSLGARDVVALGRPGRSLAEARLAVADELEAAAVAALSGAPCR
jgi:glycerate kinase